jgi:hypothetical protein
MSTTAVIWLGILAWVVLAVVTGFILARVIKLRDRQRPGSTEPDQSTDR